MTTHTLMVWGDNASRQITDAPNGKFKAIATGGSINGLALKLDGTPILWGGVGPIGPPPITDALATEKFHAVALGRDDAVLTRLDGTLVGIGKNVPVRSVPAGSYHAVAVAAVHAVAIAHDGALTTWGSDSTTLPTGDVVTGLRRQPSTSWRSRLVPDRSRLSGIWRRGWYWTDARDASENA